MIRRKWSMTSFNCRFFSTTCSMISLASSHVVRYASDDFFSSDFGSGSSLNGIRLSMCVYSMPCSCVFSLHFSYIKRRRLNRTRIVRNCSWTFAFFSLLLVAPWTVPFGGCKIMNVGNDLSKCLADKINY